MAKIKTPSFKIILYTYKTLSDGTHPIMIRVTYDRKQKYFSLGLSAIKENWNAQLARIETSGKRLSDQQKRANILLGQYSLKLNSAEKHFDSIEFSFDRFDRYFFQSNVNTTVFTFFQSIIDELIDEDRIGSALAYRGTLSMLKKFRQNKDLTFRDIDTQFLDDWKKHLRKTNGVNSIGIYFRTFKAIYKRAEKKGIVNPGLTPWTGYKIETAPTRKRSLTKEQVELLRAYKAEPGSSQWHSLNFWLFSYQLRGMNFGDMVRLTQDNIRNGRIFYTREKTGDMLDVNIDQKVAQILLNYSSSDHFIFPVLSPGLNAITIKYRIKTRLKQINADLQAIVAEINAKPENKLSGISLPTDITFYWARHTAATVLKRAGVSTAIISEILGHSSESTTKVYLGSFEKSELDSVANYL